MIDNVSYKRSVSECVKMDYLQQQKFDPTPHCPRFAPIPHSKILGTLLSCPVLKMKSRRLGICVLCRFLCILLGSFCDHCKKMYANLFSGRPSKVLP